MKSAHDQRRTSCASPSDHDMAPLKDVHHLRTTKTGVACQVGCDRVKGKIQWAIEEQHPVISKDVGVMNRWARWGAFVWCRTLSPPLWSLLDWASVNGFDCGIGNGFDCGIGNDFDCGIGNVNGSADGSRAAPRLLRSHHSPQPPACQQPDQDGHLAHPYPVQNLRQDRIVAYSQGDPRRIPEQ